jgi:RNA polymerase-interacting CarD/CdnL/TRCF family regulator
MPFEELKQRQSVVWGSGPYQGIAETVADLHRDVVQRLDPQSGQRFLDLATGGLEFSRTQLRTLATRT